MISLKSGEAILRWVLQQADDDQPYNVTLGATADSVSAASDFAGVMASSWHDNLRSSTTTQLTLVTVEGIYFDGTHEHSVAHDLGEAGTGGTGVLPSNCALLVSKVTDFAGRKYRGRMYWPSMLAEGNVDINGVIDGAVVTALQGHFDDLFADLDAVSGASPALLHDKVTDDVIDDTPATLLSSFIVKPKIATQRRRLRGT